MLIRLAAATVVGGIVFFVVGFLIYGLFLDPAVMRPNMNEFAGLIKDVPDWAPLIIANLVSALLFAWIYDALAGIRSFAAGAKAGAIIMALISLSLQLMFYAFWNLHKNLVPVVADLAGSLVMGAIGGGAIAAVLGAMQKKDAT